MRFSWIVGGSLISLGVGSFELFGLFGANKIKSGERVKKRQKGANLGSFWDSGFWAFFGVFRGLFWKLDEVYLERCVSVLG